MSMPFIGGFLTPFVTSLSNLLIFCMLEKNRYRKSLTVLIISACVTVSTLWGGIVFSNFGAEHYIKNLLLTQFVPMMIGYYLLSGQRNSKTVFTVMTATFLGFLGTAPCITLKKNFGFNVLEYNLLRIVTYTFIVIFLHRCVQIKYRRVLSEIDKGWLIFSGLPGFIIVISYYLMNRLSNQGTVLLAALNILLVLLFFLYAMFYYIFKQLSEKYKLLERERMILLQNRHGKQLLERQRASIEEIRLLRHDLRHHLRTALNMIEQGNVSEAAAHFSHLLKSVESFTLHNFCENKNANYVFSYFSDKAKSENIELSITAVIEENCGIDPVDLGGILSNILENAIEGCLRVPASSRRFIDFSCTTERSMLLIQSKNSCVDDIRFIDELPVSSKSDGGIGTQSIVVTAEKYSGIADFSANANVFHTRVVLHAK